MSIDRKAFGISDSLVNAVSEALKGNQAKLDKNHNGKLDGQDFKMLRKEELKGGQAKLDKNHNGKLDGQDFKMLRKEEAIDEKAVSKAQQHAAGAALATQRGEYAGGKKGGAINRMASMKTSELRKFAGTKTKGLPTHKEEVEQVDEISLKTKMNAYKAAKDPEADYSYGSKVHSQADRLRSKIVAKHGEKAGDHADRAAHGKPSTPATRSAEKAKPDPLTHNSTNKMRTTKSGVANKQDQKTNANIIKSRIGKHGKSNLPEDIEQVDELSKKTLGSYIKKAATDVATNSAATGRHAERSNKIADHQKKTGDYSKETQRRKDSQTADKAFDKSWKRRQGINKATDKLTKEEAEQVDELSRKTLGSYAYKADKQLGKVDANGPSHKAGIPSHYRGINKTLGKNPADKMRARKAGIKLAVNKLAKEEIEPEPVNELKTDTYHSAAHKAAKKAMGDAQGRSGPIFKKYAGMANKFRDKGMSQEKKEKAMKEENIDEAGRVLPDLSKPEPKGQHSKDYMARVQNQKDKASEKRTAASDYLKMKGSLKAAKMKAYRADRDKHMEEEIQIDEISKKLAARYNNKVARIVSKNQNSGGDPDKLRQRKNREAGHKLSWNKYHNYKVKVPATEETDPGFAEAAENPMAKQLADKKASIEKTIAQKKMQVMQAKANKQISSMKEAKCTCAEGKKSMTCEVCNDKSKGMKGGKEAIQMNPPLRD